MAGSKHKLYNINPVLNKWEEDNYARLMERKVKGAKSAGYAATSTSPTRTHSGNSSSTTMRTSTCQHTSLGCPASPTTRSPHLAAQAAGPAQQAPDAAQAGQILQQLQRLMVLPEATQKKLQQQGLKQHGQHERTAAQIQSDADTAPADDLNTCSPQAAAAAGVAAAVQPAELLQCLTAAAGPLVNLLQQLALTQADMVGSSSPPGSAVPPAAAAAGHVCHPLSSPASGKQQLPGAGPSSPGRRTASPTRKQIPSSSSRAAPSGSSSSSSSPARRVHIPKHSAARSPGGAAKQAAPARHPSGNSKPAWNDNYLPPPPVGFAGFMPLMVPCTCARGAKPLSPSTAAGSRSPPLRKQQQQQQHGKSAQAVGTGAGSGRAVQAAATAAATRAVGRKLQQTTAATTAAAAAAAGAAAAAAAAAPRLAGERHKGSSPAASKPRLPAAHGSPPPPAAAAAAAGDAAGSLLYHMRLPVAPAVSGAGVENSRYVDCRDTDDLASYRSTAASEADNASSLAAAYDGAGAVHAEVLCCNEGVYLPLVQHINSSNSSRPGSLRAASAGSSGSHEAHTTWGSSHASSRTHSGHRQQEQQQHEVHGSQAAGLSATAASAAFVGGGGMEDGWQQQGCRVVLHSDSLDLLGGNAQLRASDLLLLRPNSSSTSSNGGNGSCWASRWLCAHSSGGTAQAEAGAPPEGAQRGGAAAWEPSASVLQCCSEEADDYGDNVWEGVE